MEGDGTGEVQEAVLQDFELTDHRIRNKNRGHRGEHPELDAMSVVAQVLLELSPPARQRVVQWLESKVIEWNVEDGVPRSSTT